MTSPSTYTDLWADYRAIGTKLKKRLLRKPNYGEAAKEYAQLANRLHNDEISPHYAALCHQNAARYAVCDVQSSPRVFADAIRSSAIHCLSVLN
jgi:hypothetical protein